MLDAAFVSLFHSFEQVLHLTSPWRRILPVRYGRGLSLSHTRNVLHSPPHALHLQLARNSSTGYTPLARLAEQGPEALSLDRLLELAVLALLEVADRDDGLLGLAEQLLEP